MLTPPPLAPPLSLVLADSLYMVTVPALLGMARALQGCQVSRREAFWSMCAPYCETWVEGDSRWEMLRDQMASEEKYNMALFKVVSKSCSWWSCSELQSMRHP